MAATYTTQGELSYLERLELYKTTKPYSPIFRQWNTPGAWSNNLSISYYQCTIHDMRTSDERFSTDVQGFELTKLPITLTNEELRNGESLRQKYYPEAERFLEERYGAKVVCIFDFTIRDMARKKFDSGAVLKSEQIMGVAKDVHVDQTPGSVYRRLKRNLPNDFERLKSRHIQVVKYNSLANALA